MSLREELEKVIGLSEAATSGPWEACDRGSYGEENEGSVWNDFMHDIDAVSTVRPLSSQDTIRGDTTYRDAAFIAAVANLIRDHGQELLDAVEAVEDAKRYRWIRDSNADRIQNGDTHFEVFSDNGFEGKWVGSDLDSAIDADRRKTADQAIDAAIKGDGG